MLKLNHNKFLIPVLILLSSLWLNSVYAYECVVDTDGDGVGDGSFGATTDTFPSFACGADSVAENGSMALGRKTIANGVGSIAIGENSIADDIWSLALGDSANSTGQLAISIGSLSDATGFQSTAIGSGANVAGHNSTVVGYNANANSGSPRSIALGKGATAFNAPGSIAIGADLDEIGGGARATARGAIALGADVVADTPNTMQVGVPIRIERGDGTSQLRVTETSTGSSVRTLMSLICETCTPGFRFNQLQPNNQTWFFRMLQNGDFSMDDPLTVAREAQFKSGGDLIIGGTLVQASSREIKTNFTELDNMNILNKIGELPITQWSYKKDNGKIDHIGPVSEDFYQMFGLGENNKGISSVDTSGVALAAIKALKTENDLKTKQIDQLQDQIEDLRAMLTSMVALNQSNQVEDRF